MSERDPAAELADIAASVKRYVERERAAGTGELLARGATAVRVRTRSKRSEENPAAPQAIAPPATAPTAATAPIAPTAPAPTVAPTPIAPSAPAPTAAPTPVAPTAVALTVAPTPIAPPATAPTPPALFDETAPASADLPAPGRAYAFDLPAVHPPLNSIEISERALVQGAAYPMLEQIAAEARACRKCGLCETRTHAVPGVGSATGGIVFVGEAPGADEDAQGEPFVGRAGQLLTQIIKAMDDKQMIPGVTLDRSTVYIVNVLKCRPPGNRDPLPHEIEACAPYLRRQLDVLEPRVICCLGKFAAELLVGVKGTIASLRGKVYRYQGSKLIVTYHPAACLRNPGYKRPVWEDMHLLAREYLGQGVL